jgi:hypothetical protein
MRVICTIATAGVILAACGTSGPSNSASTTTTISVSAAATQYLAAVAPVNASLDSFSKEADEWSNTTTDAQAATEAKPTIEALQNLSAKLTSDEWPSNTVSDVHTLVGDIGALTGDLQGLSTFDMLDASSWEATFVRDVTSLKTAVGLVRHDLNLPPATD